MKGLVITHGNIIDKDFYKNLDYDFCICADGGLEYADKLGIIPDVIVGDFDSCDKAILNKYIQMGIKVEKHPTEKDYTDTQLATYLAVDYGCDDITIIGAIGNRLDHTIANIHILADLAIKGISARIINEYNTICIINNEMTFNGKKGDIISLIPFGGNASGLEGTGLYYKLPEKMDIFLPCGVSNVFTENRVWVKVKTGMLLAILARDALGFT